MSKTLDISPTISVIGLGYVGLPLAVSLAKSFSVVGLDVKKSRVKELHEGHDSTGEISPQTLKSSTLKVTSDVKDIADCNIHIITVPTPIDEDNHPDLRPLKAASKAIAPFLKRGHLVVYESTVYPGVTEDFCAPILERFSKLKAGSDFFLGYSPERINPGDKVHTLSKITKVVAGQTPEIAEMLRKVYGTINNDNIFVAKDIRTAEAAKVIENTQRDINIAFVNEIAKIFSKMGLSVYDVLEAAGTKWNFLNFRPGLVGGHCIGVDPYYLAQAAYDVGSTPEIILAGRRINEDMGGYISRAIHKQIEPNVEDGHGKILVLGLTFKENVPDLRNTKVTKVIRGLSNAGHTVHVHDPLANKAEAKKFYDVDLMETLEGASEYDAVIGAVCHKPYMGYTATTFEKILKPGGYVVDLKNMWRDLPLGDTIKYWSL